MATTRVALILCSFALTGSGCSDATEPQTEFDISGLVSASGTWRGTVTLTADAEILAGVSITVAPGTVFEGADGAVLRVGGSLTIDGTLADPISMEPSAAATSWGGLVAEAGGIVRIRHASGTQVTTLLTCETGALECVIDGATFNDFGQALVAASEATIQNSVLEDMSTNAVVINVGGDVTITDSGIWGAPGDLVIVSGGSLTMSYSDIGSVATNEHDNVHISSSTHVSISYCNIVGAEYGITIGNTSNAAIQNNNFLDNVVDVLSLGSNVAIDMSSNYWDSGQPSGLGGQFQFNNTSPTPISGTGPRT